MNLLLAVSQLDPTLRMVFFLVALVLFILAAVGVGLGRVNLIAAGLGFFAFPFFWDALAAS
jgi:hypothetical protein